MEGHCHNGCRHLKIKFFSLEEISQGCENHDIMERYCEICPEAYAQHLNTPIREWTCLDCYEPLEVLAAMHAAISTKTEE